MAAQKNIVQRQLWRKQGTWFDGKLLAKICSQDSINIAKCVYSEGTAKQGATKKQTARTCNSRYYDDYAKIGQGKYNF